MLTITCEEPLVTEQGGGAAIQNWIVTVLISRFSWDIVACSYLLEMKRGRPPPRGGPEWPFLLLVVGQFQTWNERKKWTFRCIFFSCRQLAEVLQAFFVPNFPIHSLFQPLLWECDGGAPSNFPNELCKQTFPGCTFHIVQRIAGTVEAGYAWWPQAIFFCFGFGKASVSRILEKSAHRQTMATEKGNSHFPRIDTLEVGILKYSRKGSKNRLERGACLPDWVCQWTSNKRNSTEKQELFSMGSTIYNFKNELNENVYHKYNFPKVFFPERFKK